MAASTASCNDTSVSPGGTVNSCTVCPTAARADPQDLSRCGEALLARQSCQHTCVQLPAATSYTVLSQSMVSLGGHLCPMWVPLGGPARYVPFKPLAVCSCSGWSALCGRWFACLPEPSWGQGHILRLGLETYCSPALECSTTQGHYQCCLQPCAAPNTCHRSVYLHLLPYLHPCLHRYLFWPRHMLLSQGGTLTPVLLPLLLLAVCASGHVGSATNTCIACAPGTFAPAGATPNVPASCQPCPQGSVARRASERCTKCGAYVPPGGAPPTNARLSYNNADNSRCGEVEGLRFLLPCVPEEEGMFTSAVYYEASLVNMCV
jgi:hypothetical protein